MKNQKSKMKNQSLSQRASKKPLCLQNGEQKPFCPPNGEQKPFGSQIRCEQKPHPSSAGKSDHIGEQNPLYELRRNVKCTLCKAVFSRNKNHNCPYKTKKRVYVRKNAKNKEELNSNLKLTEMRKTSPFFEGGGSKAVKSADEKTINKSEIGLHDSILRGN